MTKAVSRMSKPAYDPIFNLPDIFRCKDDAKGGDSGQYYYFLGQHGFSNSAMAFGISARLILIVRTALYAVIIICSLIIFSALAVSMNKHKNNCLLYAEVKKSYGSASTCNYSIAIAVIFCLLCPIAVIVLTVLTFIGIVKDKLIQFAELPFLIQVIADGVAFFLVLISACTISVGFKTLCDSLVGGTNVPCSNAAVLPGYDISKKDYFYENLSAAEGGAWTAAILWLVQLIGGLFVLWWNGRLPCLPCLPPPKDQPSSPPQEVPATF